MESTGFLRGEGARSRACPARSHPKLNPMATPPTPANRFDGLPAWARTLSEKYYSRTISMFVLHGNVRDLVPLKRGASIEYMPLLRFLQEGLFPQRDISLVYDRGGGLTTAQPSMQEDFRRALAGYDSFHGTKYSEQ